MKESLVYIQLVQLGSSIIIIIFYYVIIIIITEQGF